MEDPYQRAIEVNDDLVCLVDSYQDTGDHDTLLELFVLLESTTMQEIFSVLRKSGLPKDLREDMKQEAYLKLRDACICYRYGRCPVFITYWRTCLRNHLIKVYKKQWRHASLKEERVEDPIPESSAYLALEEVKLKLIAEFSAWENKTQSALAIKILLERIWKRPDERITQKEISVQFSITQAHVSNWEKWVREKISVEYRGDFV